MSDCREEFEVWLELIRKADARGIKMWQDAGEGRELKHPGHDNLVAFLLEEIDRLKEENTRLKAELSDAVDPLRDLYAGLELTDPEMVRRAVSDIQEGIDEHHKVSEREAALQEYIDGLKASEQGEETQ